MSEVVKLKIGHAIYHFKKINSKILKFQLRSQHRRYEVKSTSAELDMSSMNNDHLFL